MNPKDQQPEPAGESTPNTPGPHRTRTIVLSIVGGVIVLALIVGGLVYAGVRGADNASSNTTSSPSATASPTPSATAAPTPSGSATASPTPTVDPAYGQAVAATVSHTETAAFGTGVTAKIASMKSITVAGGGVGQRSGPGTQVTVALMNGSASALDLTNVVVNAYYGSGKTPATPIPQSGKTFSGSLAAGATADGTYVFTVPKSSSDAVTITVSIGAAVPLVAFQ